MPTALQKKRHWLLYTLLLLLLTGVAVVLSLTTGEIAIRLTDIPRHLSDTGSLEHGVLWHLRIPRTLLGFAIGGGLSLAGAILQGIYRNPLVEPYTLGISGGASLGVTLVIVLGLQSMSIVFLPVAGFIGALATIFLVYTLSIRKGALNITRMLLIGLMISFISSSIMMFLMSITTRDNIPGIVFWIMGSLSAQSNPMMVWGMVSLSLICLFLAYLFVMPLNALRLGEVKATHLGINANATIRILFIITSLLAGACVAVAGIIGFVGLVIPHIVRQWVGTDYRILLISSFFSGSIFLILCDIVARTIISPNELPIGVITGIVGGVFFVILLSRSLKKTPSL